jgi:hypothetical protein
MLGLVILLAGVCLGLYLILDHVSWGGYTMDEPDPLSCALRLGFKLIPPLFLLALLTGCPGPKPPTPPSPPPTPPPQMKFLAVLGNQFSPPILGSTSTHCDWPLSTPACLDQIAAAHLNFTDFRPSYALDSRPNFEAYLRVPGTQTFDLTKWNPSWWTLQHDRAAYAASKGIYVLTSPYDWWWQCHEELAGVYWRKGNNIQGVDTGHCGDGQGTSIPPVMDAWIRKTVDNLGDLPNVFWDDGNEAFKGRLSPAFVTLLRVTIQDEEKKRGFARHIFGTQSANLQIEAMVDFASRHDTAIPAARSYPIQVNEYTPECPALYLGNLAAARSAHIYRHFWFDDNCTGGAWDDPAWLTQWAPTLMEMGGVQPFPSGCTFPCPTGAECSVIEVCRPCTPPIPGSPKWDGDFGAATEAVLAANPTRFQGRHLIGGAANAQWLYQAIVAQLASKGICAVPREDAVELSEDSVHDEEFHVLAFGSGDVAGPANQYGFKSRSRRP